MHRRFDSVTLLQLAFVLFWKQPKFPIGRNPNGSLDYTIVKKKKKKSFGHCCLTLRTVLFVQVYLWDRIVQRSRRIAWDFRQHHQWFCPTTQGGAQDISDEGPDTAAQVPQSQSLPRTGEYRLQREGWRFDPPDSQKRVTLMHRSDRKSLFFTDDVTLRCLFDTFFMACV